MFQAPGPRKVVVEKTPKQAFAGALFIPEQARVLPMDGTVRAVGSKVSKDITVGSTVLVEWRHGGTQQFEHEGKEYWLLNEPQVVAIIG